MKRFVLFFTISLICLIPSFAKASEGYYVGVLAGPNLLYQSKTWYQADYETGYALGAYAGYKFCNNVRLEVEFDYRRNNLSRIKFDEVSFHCGHRRSFSFMVNGLYELNLCSVFRPYLGAGLGVNFDRFVISGPGYHSRTDNTRFAMQAIGGVSYEVYCNTDLDLDYRFYWGSNNLYNHLFSLGLKYYF